MSAGESLLGYVQCHLSACILSVYGLAAGADCWSVREGVRWLPRHSLLPVPNSITSPALLLCYWSLIQLDNCTLLQRQAYHWGRKTHMTTATTTASVLPHSTQEGSHSASQTPPPTPRTFDSPPVRPSCHNALSLSSQYKWTRVSAYSAAFQKGERKEDISTGLVVQVTHHNAVCL